MKVLVTGGTSLLGASLARRLDERGDQVTVFQRGPSGLELTERLGSITDGAAVAAASAGMDAVVHLAARLAVTGPWTDFEATNVRGTRHCDRQRQPQPERHVSSTSRRRPSPTPARPWSGLVPGPQIRTPPEATTPAARPRLNCSRSPRRPTASRWWRFAPTSCGGRATPSSSGASSTGHAPARLAIVGSGAALIDTTYIDNAARRARLGAGPCARCSAAEPSSSPTASRVRCVSCSAAS